MKKVIVSPGNIPGIKHIYETETSYEVSKSFDRWQLKVSTKVKAKWVRKNESKVSDLFSGNSEGKLGNKDEYVYNSWRPLSPEIGKKLDSKEITPEKIVELAEKDELMTLMVISHKGIIMTVKDKARLNYAKRESPEAYQEAIEEINKNQYFEVVDETTGEVRSSWSTKVVASAKKYSTGLAEAFGVEVFEKKWVTSTSGIKVYLSDEFPHVLSLEKTEESHKKELDLQPDSGDELGF